MKIPRPTYIHLGLPKTATTCIQNHLFLNHSQIHYFGKVRGYGFAPAIEPVMPNDISQSNFVLKCKPDDIRLASLEKQMSYAIENNLAPVISKEALAGGNALVKREQAELFKKTFGNCKAILFVREPESFIKSYYVQMLIGFQKNGKRVDRWMKRLGKPPRYFDINEWMSVAWPYKNSPVWYLSYADTAEIYASVFGRENVNIFIFEELVRSPKTLITRLCNYMDIDAEEGFSLVDGKRENDRLTTGYIDRLQAVEKSFIGRHRFRLSDTRERLKMLTPAADTGSKIMPELTEEWREAILAFGAEQNRRLVNEWNVPLADYGYRF